MEDKTIDILCTLGPSSLNERTIKRLEETGVSLFRINLSHTRKEDIENVVRAIQEYTNVPVCLDTEGPQVRTGNVEGNKIFLVERSKVMLLKKKVTGTSEELQMRPESIFASLRIGDLVSIDFDSVLLAVTAI
ncbi:MAG: sulfate adenylyltransferase, partial [Candidatus Omnitrophica bacterium]|nr:sulfate adenylyltransferase [Candidatus Omnitrophota bacterium]